LQRMRNIEMPGLPAGKSGFLPGRVLIKSLGDGPDQ
jgi:hypothetical protein